jgi:CubicO group peptidase (beta-lactamase class C family)
MSVTAQQAALEAMTKSLDQFGEIGLQVAAYHLGERVVHAWVGEADPLTGRAVDEDTLFLMFSCSKGVTATVIHRLAERGMIDYEAPIADYWPEFAQNGKGGITVRHILSHRAGLPEVAGLSWVDQSNLATAATAIERASPVWPAGSTLQYHPVTFGSILGNLACRVTGVQYRDLVVQEVGSIAKISDLYFGIPADNPQLVSRRAPMVMAKPFPADPRAGIPSEEAWTGARRMVELGEDPRWIHGVMPAANLTCTADALARHYAAINRAGGGKGGLLRPETIRTATVLHHGDDGQTLAHGMGLGYMLGGLPEETPTGWRFAPWHGAFGHDGSGGRAGMYCPKHDLAIALAKNAHAPSGFALATWTTIVLAIAEALGLQIDVQ